MVNVPKVSINTDRSDALCFGCGQKNPIGLKLNFKRDGEVVRAEFTPGPLFQGWSGIVHGGIITCMLDEAMSHAAHFSGTNCLTARIEIRLRQPAVINEPLIITGRTTKNTRRVVNTEAKVALRDGTVVAEATGIQYVIEKVTDDTSNKTGKSRDDA